LSVLRLSVAVVTAAVLVAAALALINRDPSPETVLGAHVAIAPGPSKPHPAGRVTGTTMTPQQAADAAVEDGLHPDLVPLPETAFETPIARYRGYAVRQARGLIRAVDRRDWSGARDRWLLAGAAYGALGSLGDEIAAGLTRAPRGAPRLAAAARRLPAALRHAKLSPQDYATRAHEILEDAQRDLFSARETADGVAATRTVIGTLRGVLAGRGDVLQQVDSRLARLSETLSDIRRAHGGWPGSLGRAKRERLNGRLGAALEALAGVPGALETSAPPKTPSLP
jgi:hypothetical protein